MKIGMLHATLPSENRKKEGGVTYQVHLLANALTMRGHQVTIHAFDPKPSDALYEVEQIRAPDQFDRRRLLRYYLAPLLMARQDMSTYDVVHAHGDDWLVFSRRPAWVRTFYGAALAEARSSDSVLRRWNNRFLHAAEYSSSLKASCAVGISHLTAGYFPCIKDIIPCAVDTHIFKPESNSTANGKGSKSEQPSILFVGTMGGRKRGRWLLDVFRNEIRPRHPKAELWIVADEIISEDGIRSYGKVMLDQLVSLYQRAWVFCLPSLYEGFGVPYIEAMACGTPVVASPNGGAQEVLDDGKFGIIARDEEMGKTLCALFMDNTRRCELAEKALRHVERYRIERVVEQYEAIYRAATSGVGAHD